MEQLEQLTAWGEPLEVMHTKYGYITFREWVNLEKQRLEFNGKIKCEVRPKKRSAHPKIALFRTIWKQKKEPK